MGSVNVETSQVSFRVLFFMRISSGDLFNFPVSVIHFYSYPICYPYFGTFSVGLKIKIGNVIRVKYICRSIQKVFVQLGGSFSRPGRLGCTTDGARFAQ